MFGIRSEKIQQKLLDSKDLTFRTAVEIAESCESGEAGVKSLHIREEGITVNQLHTMKGEKPKIEKYAHASKP